MRLDALLRRRVLVKRVSIHAPREGCDIECEDEMYNLKQFQFTHPGRGATENFARQYNLDNVSIHAPREGCDGTVSGKDINFEAFQFTHPGRGATDGL